MGTGKRNALFGQPEKYRKGSEVSITPISGLKMRGGTCGESITGPGAKDVGNVPKPLTLTGTAYER